MKWLKKQPLPLKILLVLLVVVMVGRIMRRPRDTSRGGFGWDPTKFSAGGRWGGL